MTTGWAVTFIQNATFVELGYTFIHLLVFGWGVTNRTHVVALVLVGAEHAMSRIISIGHLKFNIVVSAILLEFNVLCEGINPNGYNAKTQEAFSH